MVAADFNHDGRPDVAIAGAGINLVAVFYTQPDGGIMQKNIVVSTAVNVLVSGDFNRDGSMNLSAASTAWRGCARRRRGRPRFHGVDDSIQILAAGQILAADVNEDGWLESRDREPGLEHGQCPSRNPVGTWQVLGRPDVRGGSAENRDVAAGRLQSRRGRRPGRGQRIRQRRDGADQYHSIDDTGIPVRSAAVSLQIPAGSTRPGSRWPTWIGMGGSTWCPRLRRA